MRQANMLWLGFTAAVSACGGLGAAPSAAAGTTVRTTAMAPISSATNHAGDAVELRVSRDVMATDGRTVVIPAGAVVTATIVRIAGAPARGERGELSLAVKRVEFDGKGYPLAASTTGYQFEMKPHAIGVNEVAKTGAGAVVGGIVGHAVGGDVGTVVGAVGGGAAGAAIAAKDLDRDLVVHSGASVTLALQGPFRKGAGS